MRYYDPSKNPDGAHLDGVPLRDLTDDDLAALPPWLRASVEVCGFYTTEAPPTPAIDPAVLAPLAGADVPAGDLAADLAQPATLDEAASAADDPSPRRRR